MNMAHLIAYAQMSTDKNALAGVLAKAQCDICGNKFGSLKEAKECEVNHLRDFIGNPLKEALQKEHDMPRYTDIDLLIDKIEETNWYHINKNGELVAGANSKTDIPLYKHSDIKQVLTEAPIVDVDRNKHCLSDKKPPKHPSYNCQRGMLCPTCDKALWVRVEIKSLFGTKKITIKEQPNFCKYCGQALLPAYTEY